MQLCFGDYRSLAVTASIVAPALSAVFVFVEVFEHWYLAQLAVLAPLVAWLCVAGHPSQTLTQISLVLLFGAGGLFWGFCAFELSAAFGLAERSRKFLAIVLNLPGIFAISGFRLPRVCGLGQSVAVLLLTTLSIYKISDPLKAGLAVAGGAVAALLVTTLLSWKFLDKRRCIQSQAVFFEEAIDRYLVNLIDCILLPPCSLAASSLSDAHKTAKRAILTDLPFSLHQPAFALLDVLKAVHTLVVVASNSAQAEALSISPPLCAWLTTLRWTVVAGGEAEGATEPTVGAVGAKLEAGLRLLVRGVRLRRRFATLRKFPTERTAGVLFRKTSERIWREAVGNFSWRLAGRNAAVVGALSVGLVFWDEASPAVDAAAMWALLPALLVIFPIRTGAGETLMRGAQVFLGSLLGGSLGVLTVVVNGASGNAVAYASQFGAILTACAFCRKFEKFPCAASMVYMTWMICGLSQKFPSEEISDSRVLWRAALYRLVIVNLALAVGLCAATLMATPMAREIGDLKDQIEKDTAELVSSTFDKIDFFADTDFATNTLVPESLTRTLSFLSPPSTPTEKIGNFKKFPIKRRVDLARKLHKAETLGQFAKTENFRFRRQKISDLTTTHELLDAASAAVAAAMSGGFAGAATPNFDQLKQEISDFFGNRKNPRKAVLEISRLLSQLRRENSDQPDSAVSVAVGNFSLLLDYCRVAVRAAPAELLASPPSTSVV